MPKKIAKGFTLLELLVVIAILGVFTVIAYPNITKWITDREVKKEVYDFVAEINEMKSKVSNGKYALAMVHFTTPNNQYAYMKKYYMTTEDFIYNYKGDTFKSGNTINTCDYDPRNMRYQSDGYFESKNIRHWDNLHMCISKNGVQTGYLFLKNPETGQSKSLNRVVFCSVTNSTTSGSKRCNINNKLDYRYMLTWDRFVNLTVYKFNFKKNQWCTSKTCRSYSEFN